MTRDDIIRMAREAGIEFFNSTDPEFHGREYCEAWIEEQHAFANLVVAAALRAAIEQAPWVKSYAGGKPNYTTPEEQTRQWQGLTDEEIAEVRHLYDGTAGWTIERFARAIEAKLKEKNHG